MSTQDEIFAASEADQWFERNKHVLEQVSEQDVPLRLVEIAKRTGARAVAVEPSPKAIEDGRARFPHVEFRQGQARDLPVTETFELVIVHFVLHWIDRRNLLTCVAEIDRAVADGGYLIIGDFHPWHPARNKYHHLPDSDVMTYKQDYAQIFLATELYHPVVMLTGYGLALDPAVADDRRTGVTLLRKRL